MECGRVGEGGSEEAVVHEDCQCVWGGGHSFHFSDVEWDVLEKRVPGSRGCGEVLLDLEVFPRAFSQSPVDC